MIADKIDVKWICYVRGDMFNDSIAELMAKAGCHQILIGIESGESYIDGQDRKTNKEISI